ncbi:EF-P lysine aminoacylase EpmA [Methylocapsa palsarum]|uniref:Lysyl-tRNA synthetase, class 2 n=1 Tax=Methylocapsa palsarum TaxID=1612308 RepID=A0A1I3X488_9HYPH|nr:EF-P lysine aminoacylase EpmA [Methylocapsa palsarum]SFK14488.1 lysyl-tRNA synthetase, class 2 [Methylocapsa palsarum]
MSKPSSDSLDKPSPWWSPQIHSGRRRFLEARTKLTAAAREFFAAESFVEVDCAILQASPGNEAHISAFATEIVDPSGARLPLYLPASPEFACKKLLSAGEKRIFTLAHAFRNRERGKLHHPEFTMLEWYRANEPYQRLVEDCAGLLAACATAVGCGDFSFAGSFADPFAEPEVLSVAEAFDRFAGIDLCAVLGGTGPDRERFAACACKIGIRIVEDDTWSDVFSKILCETIEPHLGQGQATILIDYPAGEAALARLGPDKRFAERFELFVCGVELANGFGELTDPAEQRRRFEAEMTERRRIYGESYPLDEDFLEALAIMPEASGIALGFDRLVMLATGAQHIEQVIWTPVVRNADAT